MAAILACNIKKNIAEIHAINYLLWGSLWLDTMILIYIIILRCVYPAMTCHYNCCEKRYIVSYYIFVYLFLYVFTILQNISDLIF